MKDVLEVVSSVADARESVQAARRRSPIGFRRAFVAGFMGAGVGLLCFVLPGLVSMVSVNRWMSGTTRRPVAALVVGFAMTALVTVIVLLLPLVLLDEATAESLAGPWRIVALVATALLMVPTGRFLFARPTDGTRPVQ